MMALFSVIYFMSFPALAEQTRNIMFASPQYSQAQWENYDRRPYESDEEYAKRREEARQKFDEENRDDARKEFDRDNPNVEEETERFKERFK